MGSPWNVAIDTVHNEIFFTNTDDSITVYKRTPNNKVRHLRTLAGPSTQMIQPSYIAVDPVNDEIFVASCYSRSIIVFGRTAAGNTEPLRKISSLPGCMLGLTIDSKRNELYLMYLDRAGLNAAVYKRTAVDDDKPVRALLFAARPGFCSAGGATFDKTNGQIFVTETDKDSVFVFNMELDLIRTIAGSKTGLRMPTGIAVDPDNHELFVANSMKRAVRCMSDRCSGRALMLGRDKNSLSSVRKAARHELAYCKDSFNIQVSEGYPKWGDYKAHTVKRQGRSASISFNDLRVMPIGFIIDAFYLFEVGV